jgi:hypothetical protein
MMAQVGSICGSSRAVYNMIRQLLSPGISTLGHCPSPSLNHQSRNICNARFLSQARQRLIAAAVLALTPNCANANSWPEPGCSPLREQVVPIRLDASYTPESRLGVAVSAYLSSILNIDGHSKKDAYLLELNRTTTTIRETNKDIYYFLPTLDCNNYCFGAAIVFPKQNIDASFTVRFQYKNNIGGDPEVMTIVRAANEATPRGKTSTTGARVFFDATGDNLIFFHESTFHNSSPNSRQVRTKSKVKNGPIVAIEPAFVKAIGKIADFDKHSTIAKCLKK